MNFINSVNEAVSEDEPFMLEEDSGIMISDTVSLEVEQILKYFLETYGDYRVAS